MNYRLPNGQPVPGPSDIAQRTMAEIFGNANAMNLQISDEIFTADEKREKLIEYLKVKVQECDWHGVSDVANDLRVLEAAYPKKL